MTEIFSTISNLSIIQLLILGIVIAILQRSGVDVLGFVQKMFIKKNGNKLEEKMTHLEEHFNNELTSALGRIESAVKEGFLETNRKLDDMGKDLIYLKAKQNGK